MRIKINVSGIAAAQKHIKDIANKITQLSHEQCVVTLPTDRGFTDRTCPNTACQAIFKVNMSTWSGSDVMYCVKCGKQQAKDTFMSVAQRTYATDVAINTILKKHDLGGTSRPQTYTPPDADTETVCIECACCFVVRGKFGYCPQCGRHNCLQWAIDELLVLRQQDYTQTKAIQTGYKEAVDILKTCGDRIFDIYNQRNGTKYSISLQNFDSAVDELRKKIGVNFDEAFTPTELQLITIAVNVRHICAYNAGEIDEGFIKRTKSHDSQLGRMYQLRADELQMFIGLVDRLLEFYFHAISAKCLSTVSNSMND